MIRLGSDRNWSELLHLEKRSSGSLLLEATVSDRQYEIPQRKKTGQRLPLYICTRIFTTLGHIKFARKCKDLLLSERNTSNEMMCHSVAFIVQCQLTHNSWCSFLVILSIKSRLWRRDRKADMKVERTSDPVSIELPRMVRVVWYRKVTQWFGK